MKMNLFRKGTSFYCVTAPKWPLCSIVFPSCVRQLNKFELAKEKIYIHLIAIRSNNDVILGLSYKKGKMEIANGNYLRVHLQLGEPKSGFAIPDHMDSSPPKNNKYEKGLIAVTK